MLSANEKRPLKRSRTRAPPRSEVVDDLGHPAALVDRIGRVVDLVEVRDGAQPAARVAEPGMSPEAMSCAALVASPAATS